MFLDENTVSVRKRDEVVYKNSSTYRWKMQHAQLYISQASACETLLSSRRRLECRRASCGTQKCWFRDPACHQRVCVVDQFCFSILSRLPASFGHSPLESLLANPMHMRDKFTTFNA